MVDVVAKIKGRKARCTAPCRRPDQSLHVEGKVTKIAKDNEVKLIKVKISREAVMAQGSVSTSCRLDTPCGYRRAFASQLMSPGREPRELART